MRNQTGIEFHIEVDVETSADVDIGVEDLVQTKRSGSGGFDFYTGSYTVTPKTTNQVLRTKNKLMEDDLTVKEIPTYDVGNQYGRTFVIGG